MDLMYQALKRRGTNCIWLGIDDASTEGTYTYSSDRTLVVPSVKSVFVTANSCKQTGLSNIVLPGSKDCDHVYFCTSTGKTYTQMATFINFIVCEVSEKTDSSGTYV